MSIMMYFQMTYKLPFRYKLHNLLLLYRGSLHRTDLLCIFLVLLFISFFTLLKKLESHIF
jgi:hypothetical protein